MVVRMRVRVVIPVRMHTMLRGVVLVPTVR